MIRPRADTVWLAHNLPHEQVTADGLREHCVQPMTMPQGQFPVYAS